MPMNVFPETHLTSLLFFLGERKRCPNICVPTRAAELPTFARQECVV
jgi:hypothetical protein